MTAGPGPELAAFCDGLPTLLDELQGHLSVREARFLALLAACPTAAGAVLEIGSYMGRSTVVLAKAALLAGKQGVVAVDPLDSPSSTDPDLGGRPSCEDELRANLERHDLASVVEFHRMRSEELARTWDRPLRLLWIDGDHTLEGARADLRAFAPFLVDGAIVAMHDMLHEFEGPLRVFVEDVLGSGHAGAAGVCGSIGWAQWSVSPLPRDPDGDLLVRRLLRLQPSVSPPRELSVWGRWWYKLLRSRVPHGDVDPLAWWTRVGLGSTGETKGR